MDSNLNDTAGHAIYRSNGRWACGGNVLCKYWVVTWLILFSRTAAACIFSALLLHRVSVPHLFCQFPRTLVRASWRGGKFKPKRSGESTQEHNRKLSPINC